jgi:hypothetical protein
MIARAAAALVLLTVPAFAAQWKVRTGGTEACISQEITEKIGKLRAEGDAEAAVKLLTPLVLFGQCLMLERGEAVSGEVVPNGWPMAWGSKWVSVRRKGNPADYIVAKDKLEAQ